MKEDDKGGFIDMTGKIISELQWDRQWAVSDGMILVNKFRKFSIIDNQGNIVFGWR